ncbi:MAG: methyltransferase family protein [Rhodomicrobium sp.]
MMTKLLPPTYFFAAIVLALAAHFLFPLAAIIPFRWRFAAAVPIAAGVALNLIADRQFKQLGTEVKPFKRSSALVTDGVFKWSRNPMYLGVVLIVCGIAWLEGSLSPWIAAACLALLLDRLFIAREERMLEETFGAAYIRYTLSVRRWL